MTFSTNGTRVIEINARSVPFWEFPLERTRQKMCVRLIVSVFGGLLKRVYKLLVLPIVFMFALATTLGSILEVDREYVAHYAFLRPGMVAGAHSVMLVTTLLWQTHGWMPNLRKLLFAAQLCAVAAQIALVKKWQTGAVAVIGWLLFYFIVREWTDALAHFIAAKVAAVKSGSSVGSVLYDVIEGHSEKKFEKKKKPVLEQRYGNKIIGIEGPICGGKTHLARSILRIDAGAPVILNNADRCYRSGAVVDVLPEQLAEVLHKKFVQDPAVYELPFQMVMAERRYAALHAAVRHVDKTQRIVVLDRSLAGDFSFAAWNYIIGAFDEEQFDTYLGEIPGGTPAMWFRHAVQSSGITAPLQVQLVFLVTSTAVCMQRLKRRGGVDQETAERYMRGIVVMHALVALHLFNCSAYTQVHFYDSAREMRHQKDLERFLSCLDDEERPDTRAGVAKPKSDSGGAREAPLLIDATGSDGAAALRFRRIMGMLFSSQAGDAILDAILLPTAAESDAYTVSETRLFRLLETECTQWIK